jgi:CRISPR-associated exonuclease Cas4
MKDYNEDELLALSGIQHYAFCSRQWALIHVEQQWEENVSTFEGRQMHKRADNPFITELRGDVLSTRAMPLVSYTLGVYGVADVVEFHGVTEEEVHKVKLKGRRGWWKPFPVEYKRGRPKALDWDELQLCTQAMCLEEMLSVPIVEGALFYGERERRTSVFFDAPLRQRVHELFMEMHGIFSSGTTPLAKYQSSKCNNCSLYEICLPKLKRDLNSSYLHNYLTEMAVE